MRYSKQRATIADQLRKSSDHPTAEMLYEAVRRHLPQISLGTVYRNLRAMCASGQCLAFDTGTGTVRFDGNTAPHRHFICQVCGSVHDLFVPMQLPGAQETDGHRVLFEQCLYYGVCKFCQIHQMELEKEKLA